ncbi:MAG: universal stress protein [Crocinitomicaceae bacterium]|nr:universal stress protein [Crocinitomicaceae bacterium]
MKKDTGNTIVLVDFNQSTETTLSYVNMRIKSGRNFYLVSFADNFSEEELKSKLDEFESRLDKNVAGKIIKKGGLEDNIETVVEEVGASAVIFTLNPDGKKGFFSSPRSLKLISSLNVVFVVLQHGSKIADIQTIAMPLELSNESKQKFEPAVIMAQDLEAELKIFLPKFKDEYQQNAVNRNVIWAKSYLKDKNVRYSFEKAEDRKNFEDQFIEYVNDHNADVVVILNYGDTIFSGVFGNSTEYKILTNKYKVPVMIMNYQTTYRSKVPITG